MGHRDNKELEPQQQQQQQQQQQPTGASASKFVALHAHGRLSLLASPKVLCLDPYYF